MDRSARFMTFVLALGYDWLHPRLDAATRSRLQAVLKARMGQMYGELVGERSRIAARPRDSHGIQTSIMLGAMLPLVAGDIPEADAWMARTLPLALNLISPWGGEDSPALVAEVESAMERELSRVIMGEGKRKVRKLKEGAALTTQGEEVVVESQPPHAFALGRRSPIARDHAVPGVCVDLAEVALVEHEVHALGNDGPLQGHVGGTADVDDLVARPGE